MTKTKIIMFLVCLVILFLPVDNILEISGENYIYNVSCNSNSMGIAIPCGTKALTQKYPKNKELEMGRIYIYQRNSSYNVIHRLVGCIDKDCNVTIFKGDNNLISELVNKSQITYIVNGLDYSRT